MRDIRQVKGEEPLIQRVIDEISAKQQQSLRMNPIFGQTVAIKGYELVRHVHDDILRGFQADKRNFGMLFIERMLCFMQVHVSLHVFV